VIARNELLHLPRASRPVCHCAQNRLAIDLRAADIGPSPAFATLALHGLTEHVVLDQFLRFRSSSSVSKPTGSQDPLAVGRWPLALSHSTSLHTASHSALDFPRLYAIIIILSLFSLAVSSAAPCCDAAPKYPDAGERSPAQRRPACFKSEAVQPPSPPPTSLAYKIIPGEPLDPDEDASCSVASPGPLTCSPAHLGPGLHDPIEQQADHPSAAACSPPSPQALHSL